MVSTQLSAQEIAFPVTFGAFALITGAGGDPLTEERPIASVVDGGIGFFSAARDHTTTVRVEFWDGEPANGSSDVVSISGSVTLSASGIALVAIDTGVSREVSVPFNGPAQVHVTCSGRDEAARLAYEEHEVFFSDVEHWLVRIWPRK
jgi:hypothetical protein